jgi:hypothetical protein
MHIYADTHTLLHVIYIHLLMDLIALKKAIDQWCLSIFVRNCFFIMHLQNLILCSNAKILLDLQGILESTPTIVIS